MSDHERTFRCMGTGIRLVGPDADALAAGEAWLRAFDARLSRFRPTSELSVLNADPRPVVPASALLRAAVGAALWAAAETDGLVDPTLLGALRRAGYDASLDGVAPAGLARRAGRGAPAAAGPPASGRRLARRQDRRRRGHDRAPARPRARHRRHLQGPGGRRGRRAPGRRRALRRRLRRRRARRGPRRRRGSVRDRGRPSVHRRGRAPAVAAATARSPPRASTRACGAPPAASPTTCSTPRPARRPGPVW